MRLWTQYSVKTRIFLRVKLFGSGKLSKLSGKSVENLVNKVESVSKKMEKSIFYPHFSLNFPHVENFAGK